MRSALLARLKRLETVQSVEEESSSKIEFAYLKLLPRDHSGAQPIVKVGQRPDGRDECEERPGEPLNQPNHAENQDSNVMRIYFVRAQEPSNEIRCVTD